MEPDAEEITGPSISSTSRVGQSKTVCPRLQVDGRPSREEVTGGSQETETRREQSAS